MKATKNRSVLSPMRGMRSRRRSPSLVRIWMCWAWKSGENEWLEDMRRQNQRLTVLTNDLIYLARMEEGTSKLQMIELPFSDLVEETAQSFQALAIVEKKFFHLQIQPMVMLRGDEQGLRKLVSILLDNAVKYSEENGSITPEP